jgi:hypothetical protein
MAQITQIQEDLEAFKKQNILIDLVFRGYVEDIENDDIFVHLTDMTNEHLLTHEPNEDLIASIAREKFPSHSKLEIGTIFYMYLGKKIDEKEHDEIILSRAVWTAEMIAQVKEDAEKMYQFLNTQK